MKLLKLIPINDSVLAYSHITLTRHKIEMCPDFMTNRKQGIGINGKFSSWFEVLSVIPQGDILGLLLF